MWNWLDMVQNTPNRMSHECTRMCVICVFVFICVEPCFTFRSSWYFMILCTGLMSRSFSCSLWPSCCFSSCTQTHTNIHLIDWFLYVQREKASVLDSILQYYPHFLHFFCRIKWCTQMSYFISGYVQNANKAYCNEYLIPLKSFSWHIIWCECQKLR